MNTHFSRRTRSLCWAPLVAVLALSTFAAHAGPGGSRGLSAAESARLLQAPPKMDSGARRVIARAEAAYGKLRSLKTISRDGGLTGVAYLQRPRRYRLTQKLDSGELVALAVADGTNYYEYRARKGQYLQRPAAMLADLVLPVNVRLFMDGQSAAETLKGLDGRPTVREYGYRYRGKATVNGTATERLDVSVMTRIPDGTWLSFVSERYYDVKTGLLRRAVNGDRRMDIENIPNFTVPAGTFRWVPPAGAIKGLG